MPDHDLLDPVRADIREIKESLRELAASMVKIAVVEERLAQSSTSAIEVRSSIAACVVRVTALEMLMVNSTRVSQWVDRGLVGLVVIVFMFIGNKTGIF